MNEVGAALTADGLLLRNNYNIYFILLSKGLYEDAFLVLKSFIMYRGNTESLKILDAMEDGSDNPYKLGIFELSKNVFSIMNGSWLCVPTNKGMNWVSNQDVLKILRDYKCKMHIIMNREIMEISKDGGANLPLPPQFEIPESMLKLDGLVMTTESSTN